MIERTECPHCGSILLDGEKKKNWCASCNTNLDDGINNGVFA